MLNTIAIETLPKVISDQKSIEILGLQKRAITAIQSKDYSDSDIRKCILSFNSGMQFRRKIINVIAQDGSKIVGIGSASYTTGIIISLFIEPNYQQRGIGSILLRQLEDELKAVGIQYIWFGSFTTASQFFQHHAYKVLVRHARSKSNIKFDILGKKLSRTEDNKIRFFLKEAYIKLTYTALAILIKIRTTG